jgi:hypothetical protein
VAQVGIGESGARGERRFGVRGIGGLIVRKGGDSGGGAHAGGSKLRF